jgi:hypothetical protein
MSSDGWLPSKNRNLIPSRATESTQTRQVIVWSQSFSKTFGKSIAGTWLLPHVLLFFKYNTLYALILLAICQAVLCCCVSSDDISSSVWDVSWCSAPVQSNKILKLIFGWYQLAMLFVWTFLSRSRTIAEIRSWHTQAVSKTALQWYSTNYCVADNSIWNVIVKLFLKHPKFAMEIILNRSYAR